MKKRKLLVLGLIALVLAGGLVLASCKEKPKCTGGGSSGGAGECNNYSESAPTDNTTKTKYGVTSNYKDCKDECIRIQITSGGTYTLWNITYSAKVYSCTCQ